MIKTPDDLIAEAFWHSMTTGEKAMLVIKAIFQMLVKAAVIFLVIVALVKFIMGA